MTDNLAFTADRKTLLAALKLADKVAEARSTIPILSCVLITVDGASVKLEATDLDLSLVQSVAATGTTDGRAAVPLKPLLNAVGKLECGALGVELTGDGKAVLGDATGGGVRISLPTVPADDWLTLKTVEAPQHLTLDAAVLKRDFARVATCVSTEETRYYLNGILIEAGDGVLNYVATDGHRLMRCSRLLTAAVEPVQVIVPRKAVSVLGEVIGKSAGVVDAAVGRTRASFTIGGAVLLTKLVDGTFPDYRRVIPSGDGYPSIAVNAAETLKAIKGVTAIATERTRAVKIACDHGTSRMSVTSLENGTAAISGDFMQLYAGEPVEVGFNSPYLASMIEALGGETLDMVLQDSAAPTRFTARDVPELLGVLMPMRV